MGIIEYLKVVRETPMWDRMPAISDAELDAMIDILQKNNLAVNTMEEKPLTYEEVLEICTKKCGCCVVRDDGKIECLNPYWCLYGLTEDSGLD